MTQVQPDEIQYNAEITWGADRQLREMFAHTSVHLNMHNGMGRNQSRLEDLDLSSGTKMKT